MWRFAEQMFELNGKVPHMLGGLQRLRPVVGRLYTDLAGRSSKTCSASLRLASKIKSCLIQLLVHKGSRGKFWFCSSTNRTLIA